MNCILFRKIFREYKFYVSFFEVVFFNIWSIKKYNKIEDVLYVECIEFIFKER